MRIYLAGMDGAHPRKLAKQMGYKNVLVSYFTAFYPKNNFSASNQDLKDFNVFLDSGGYVARVKGIDIDINKYADFAKTHGNEFHAIANLDVHDLKKSMDNQNKLEASGHFQKVVPVYHFSEYLSKDPKVKYLLRDFCKTHEYVALGGTAGTITNKEYFKKYLNFCFKIAMEYKTKIHGFGMTATYLLERYPFYSVDSTTWQAPSRYGQGINFKDGKIKFSSKHDDPSHLHFMHHKPRDLDSIAKFARIEQYYTDLWKTRGITWKN